MTGATLSPGGFEDAAAAPSLKPALTRPGGSQGAVAMGPPSQAAPEASGVSVKPFTTHSEQAKD